MASTVRRVIVPKNCERIALCGGPYNNFAAVEAFLKETQDFTYRFCLGDMGGFGPYPNRTLELIRNSNLICLQGNYDEAVGNGKAECGCGYLDPRDRYFAQISFDYTFKNTSEEHRSWLRNLPNHIEITWGEKKILLCHGSPESVNEFVWQTESSDEKIKQWLETFRVDAIGATHSGLPWIRHVPTQRFWFNVGVVGRPAHDGSQNVYYGTMTQIENTLTPKLIELNYDPGPVVAAMKAENLPIEFCESLEKGIWTTCCKILPAAELPVKKRS
jgi:predicted phosphodiesterase